MHSRKVYLSIFFALLYFAIFFFKQQFTGPLYQDEIHYLPTAVEFSKEPIPSLSLLKGYNELNTPIPFIFGGWVLKVFGENIQFLRLLTLAFSYSILMIFIWCSTSQSNRLFLALAGLIAFPNFYLISVFYYTDVFAMFFVLAGTACYLKKSHLIGMLCFIAAVACRQYMLAFPLAVAGYEVISNVLKLRSFKDISKQLFINRIWIYYTIAVFSIIPWLVLWNGPAPAAVMADQYYDSDKIVHYNFGFVLYASVCLAVYYVLPEVILTKKWNYFFKYPAKRPVLFGVLCVIVITLVCFSPAMQAYNPYFTWPYLGYVDQLIETIGISGLLKQIIFGVLMLITLMRFVSYKFNLASFAVLINTMLLGKAQLSWDKYSLPLIMVLWFILLFDSEWMFTREKKLAVSAEPPLVS